MPPERREHPPIVSVLGYEYPYTMMGFQAADMDAAILAERQRVKPLRERVWRKLTRWQLRLAGPRGKGVGTRLYLHATCLVVARTERLPAEQGGGFCTWYPLHIRWGWSRHKRPHWRRRRTRTEL